MGMIGARSVVHCETPYCLIGPALEVKADAIAAWNSLATAVAERDKYRAALEAIGTFCDSPDWTHEHESDGDEGGIRWYTTCHGRTMVRAMVEDALEAAKPSGGAA
jgi:hypothetical protein